jgi:2-keto-4-pentenoate hydratase/2-oxohepta-3-ene-1,7-dioic acid hydratase in catechol pathway
MKIARIRIADGATAWALIDEAAATARRIDGAFADWAPRAAMGNLGDRALVGPPEPLSEVRLRAPVDPAGRVFGVGLNYLAHLTRLAHRKEAPPHTIGYIKPQSALVDPGGVIAFPPTTRQLDFEIELVAVLARPLGDEGAASKALLGYTIGNDVSARDAGKGLGVIDLFGQKALDSSAPLGPWIATLDEVGGPGQPRLDLEMKVNGEVRQSDSTANMIFGIDELLNYLDVRVALRAGDVVFTGTTCGVGLEDGRFLQPGDHLEASIERIGALSATIGEQRAVPAARAEGRLGLPA